MKNPDLAQVLQFLKTERGFDFLGSSHSVVERGIELRVSKTGTGTPSGYYDFLTAHPGECDHLVQALTIHVSSFFRDPLVFDYLASVVFPKILTYKAEKGDRELRVWSAGCAAGEEPYSVAIALNELSKKGFGSFDFYIFGSDIDSVTLTLARKALYSGQSIESLRHGYLKYFTPRGEKFLLKDDARKMVSFSRHDLLDKKNVVPPESVFADFDIIFCRNVLIYFTPPLQEKILEKLFCSLNPGGYLILGESEAPSEKYRKCLEKVADCCQVYRKTGQ